MIVGNEIKVCSVRIVKFDLKVALFSEHPWSTINAILHACVDQVMSLNQRTYKRHNFKTIRCLQRYRFLCNTITSTRNISALN